jgi:serine/threonine protein kinase/alpha-tubulin suppressor-like RCC1 family protein
MSSIVSSGAERTGEWEEIAWATASGKQDGEMVLTDTDFWDDGAGVVSMPKAEKGGQGMAQKKSILRNGPFLSASSDSGALYEVVTKLGRGAFATCYLVKRSSDDVYFCLKRLDASIDELEKGDQDSVQQEVLALRSLSHPNVTALEESFLSRENLLHICMEYCSGESLNELLNHKRQNRSSRSIEDRMIDDKVVGEYLSQMFLALTHIHSHNIIHRDLKPANILLTGKGGRLLKVADFGISKLAANTMATTMVGTPYYLAPELCEGQPYDEACDMWAAGVILFELCTLSRPFDGSSLPALLMTILRCDPPSLTSKMLEVNGLDRLPLGYDRGSFLHLVDLLLIPQAENRPSAAQCCEIIKPAISEWQKDMDGIIGEAGKVAQASAIEIFQNIRKGTEIGNGSGRAAETPRTSPNRRDSEHLFRRLDARRKNNNLFSPFAARHHREKIADIINKHARLFRVTNPVPILLHEYLHADIQHVVMGGSTSIDAAEEGIFESFSFAIEENGDSVLGWGCNDDGQLGVNTSGRNVRERTPEVVGCSAFDGVKSLACGGAFAASVSKSNDLFLWGDLDSIALGSGDFFSGPPPCTNATGSTDSTNPFARHSDLSERTVSAEDLKQMEGGSSSGARTMMLKNGTSASPLCFDAFRGSVLSVACGADFVIMLSVDGKAYSFGRGDENVLGLNDSDDRAEPTLIPALAELCVTNVVCGDRHTLCTTEERKVFSWGSNECGQLGYPDNEDNDTSEGDVDSTGPQEIKAFQGAEDVKLSAGWWHSAAITGEGMLYTWGSNENGRLGHCTGDVEYAEEPGIVDFFSDNDDEVVDVSCGAFHTAAIVEGGLLYTWGSNVQNALGRKLKGIAMDANEPGLVKNFAGKKFIGKKTEVSKVFCGIYTTYVLCSPV